MMSYHDLTLAYRETLTKLQPLLDPTNVPLMIFVNKGMETSTRALTLEIIADTCGKDIARASTFIVSHCDSVLRSMLKPCCSLDRLLRKRVGSFISLKAT
jgi:hypothetical protein